MLLCGPSGAASAQHHHSASRSRRSERQREFRLGVAIQEPRYGSEEGATESTGPWHVSVDYATLSLLVFAAESEWPAIPLLLLA